MGRFEIESAGSGDWMLVLKDESNEQEQTVKVTDRAEGFESEAFGRTVVTVELQREEDGSEECPSVRLVEEVRAEQVAGVLRVRGHTGYDNRWGADDTRLLILEGGDLVLQASGAVAWVLRGTDADVVSRCNGFFVTSHILLTARHCMESDDAMRRSVVHVAGEAFGGSRLRWLGADDGIDVAMVWVEGVVLEARPLRLLEDSIATEWSPTFLWQYEPGGEQVVSVEDCYIWRYLRDVPDVEYSCDSDYGVSGAPVQLRSNGRVVALHQRGCVEEHGNKFCRNEGVSARRLRDWIIGQKEAFGDVNAKKEVEEYLAGR